MSHGKIGRANRRSPGAKRRAARYDQSQVGHRPTKLPPHLLPGITRRATGDGGNRLRFAIGGVAIILLLLIGGLIATTVSTVAAVTGTLTAYREVNEGLPDALDVAAGTYQTTRILDRNGVLLQEIADSELGWRTYAPPENVAQVFIDATVAAEDATFWNHRGVEPYAIGRGFFINLAGSGSSGASTITQQLVRALYPERIGQDVTYTRKGKEALAAIALEQKVSKTDILSMYVNLIFYGNRSFGVEAAAQTYFHKSASELNLAEASLLAGIPQQPTNYNPSLYPDNAKRRQTYVLDQMVKAGYITVAERDEAQKSWPKIYPDRAGAGDILDHPHFVTYVQEYLAEQYGSFDFRQGGLNIYTTIDTDLQNRAEAIVQEQMPQLAAYDAYNAAMTVMVPYTGEVLAMVGSADFNNVEIEGQVNITTSPQQPGSAIKPIVYTAAFEQGWHPGTVVLDAPFRIETPGATDPITGEPDPFYEPQNYLETFNGAVTVRTALSNSLNIPAVKAVKYIGGPAAVIDVARRMGMKNELDQPLSEYGLSIGLGAGDILPLELTNAYATLANNGRYVPATPILKVTDSDDQVLYELDRETSYERAEQAVRAEYAYQITSILTDDVARSRIFGAGNLFERTQQVLGRPTAAKSGTTNDFRDIWTMGYTTDVAIGVWVGNTRNQQLRELDGIQGAGPIWSRTMEEIHSNPAFAQLLAGPDGQPVPEQFPRPPGIIDGVVCSATGGRPTSNSGNRAEVLVQGGAPAQRCDQLSAFQQADLEEVMRTIRGRGGRFESGAVNSIEQYARAVRNSNGSGLNYVPPEPPGNR